MSSYSWSYKLLHWLMAVLIFLMFFALQGFSVDMTDSERIEMLIGHSSIGTIITMLILIRIGKRFIFKHAQPQKVLSAKLTFAAKLTHYCLYILMVLVPFTGFLTAYFHQLPVQIFGNFLLNGSPDSEIFTAIRSLHYSCIIALITLLVIHVSAAIFHRVILKDNVLSSIRPWFAKKL